MSKEENDLRRLKQEYADRNIRHATHSNYYPMNLAYLFMLQQRQRKLAELLEAVGVDSLANKRILEIGSGRGDVLHELLYHRINSDHLYGIDLLQDRIIQAKLRFPNLNMAVADAQNLPFPSQHFDVVAQFTVFSSILVETIKTNIATEMRRVVKPNGIILWYDFWLNPTNPHTKGIQKLEIRKLFPDCQFTFKRVTLAPPLARKLVPLSWTISLLLEKLLVLNTHFLVVIQPR